MKAKYRVLLSIYMVVMIALAGLLISAAWGYVAFLDTYLYGLPIGKVLLTLLGALWIVSSAILLFARSRKDEPHGALVKATDIGQIYISIEALEHLCQRYVRSISAVKDMKCRIRQEEGGVSFLLQVEYMPDTVIPEASANLQQGLKEHIETQSGMRVNSVQIYVVAPANAANIATRVE